MIPSLFFTYKTIPANKTAPKELPLDTALMLFLQNHSTPIRISEIPFVNDNQTSRVPGQFASSTIRSTLKRMMNAGLVRRTFISHKAGLIAGYSLNV